MCSTPVKKRSAPRRFLTIFRCAGNVALRWLLDSRRSSGSGNGQALSPQRVRQGEALLARFYGIDLDRPVLTGDLQIDLIIPPPGSTSGRRIPEGQCSKARVGKGSHQAPQCLRSDAVQYCWRQEMQGDKSHEPLPPATLQVTTYGRSV